MNLRLATCATALALALGLGSVCARAAEAPAGNDAEFFMSLGFKKDAMLGDGYRAVAILVRGSDDLKDAGKCRDALVEKKIAPAAWGLDAKAPLSKGQLAYMICQACGIKGGVMMRLLGPTQRYCLFECQYLELMQGGADYQFCTGGELVSVIDRSDGYLKKQAEGQGRAKERDPLAESKVGQEPATPAATSAMPAAVAPVVAVPVVPSSATPAGSAPKPVAPKGSSGGGL